ncbi:hypothetical protein [Actinoplanes rectilineatus]|uniref:hypothetical protein n=1 Tax=Actinoplanes rectilineatus TaxID=113571 RepID=UPI001FE1D333|nr:hypothetical protein [Actinoplanes rectilineatus]
MWIHIGRFWSNGEQFLAVDSAGRADWRGDSDDEFDRTLDLTPSEVGLTVGPRTAALVGGDGVVRDDSWVEIFRDGSGVLAFVQAAGPDYRKVLAAALAHPDDADLDGRWSEPTAANWPCSPRPSTATACSSRPAPARCPPNTARRHEASTRDC